MPTKNNHQGIRTWVEVDTKALENNYKVFRNLIDKKCKLMAISKSNAYGHSLIDFSKKMESLGADFIGVDSITEAIALRREGIKIPILVLGYTLPDMINKAMLNNISLTISCPEQLKELKKLSIGIKTPDTLRIHVKIDTGMHRQGFFIEDLEEVIQQLKPLKHIEIEGIYTHFAAAKNPAFPAETNKQIEQFKKACEIFERNHLKPIRHAAATGGTIVFPDSHFDMVRIGIGLFGLWPSPETESAYCETIKLTPSLSWRTVISEIKELKKGERIGYSFTETLRRDSRIAILPIGYWHGFKWNLSSAGHAIVRGHKVRIIGRVSMDMIVIDVTDVKKIKIGDEVTLIGKDGNEEISVDEMALLAGSYNYEIITQLNPLIKRIYM